MRRFRPLLLVALGALLVGVAGLYYLQRGEEQRQAPPKSNPLPPDVKAAAQDWVYCKKNDKGVDVFCIRAKSFQEISGPSRCQLQQVELQVLDEDGTSFDRFRTGTAEYDLNTWKLVADGEVEIDIGLPIGKTSGPPRVHIKTSGLTLESRTQIAHTDRPATFRFAQGEGKAVGASYDPNTRDLVLKSESEVIWRGNGPKSPAMKIQSGEVIYKESDSAILMGPWSRLERGDLRVDGGRAVVFLKEGVIDHIEAFEANGYNRPAKGRGLEFAAKDLNIGFSGNGEVDRIHGVGDARLVSTDRGARTSVNSDRLELDFDTSSGESQLRSALAKGRGVIESAPVAGGKTPPRETRVLRSEVAELKMRPGGEEIDLVETLAPGSVEFIPNAPNQRLRRMQAERISTLYGKDNQIRLLQAVKVTTRTEFPKPSNRPAPPVMLTWSRALKAEFAPEASDLTRMEQSGEFRFEQGDRKGAADTAILDSAKNLITLQGKARTWDPTGTLSADRIVTDQERGDVTAEGSVESTRQPDRAAKPAAVLSQSEPFHAKAARMFAPGARRVIHYEGGAILWQGGNRIKADSVDIDREKRTLAARGNVDCQFVEAPQGGRSKQPPVFTLIRAAEMLYTEENRTARYSGGVTMNRAGVEVVAAALRGVFAAAGSGTNLESAYADGNVRITQQSADRTRQGTGEHAVYTVGDQVVVLSGGAPQFTDSLRGSTSGAQLTWDQRNDRLLVDGREGQPGVSRMRR
jgi:lipopolysaccharide export system protein LptA